MGSPNRVSCASWFMPVGHLLPTPLLGRPKPGAKAEDAHFSHSPLLGITLLVGDVEMATEASSQQQQQQQRMPQHQQQQVGKAGKTRRKG